jgi:hypothetical protein
MARLLLHRVVLRLDVIDTLARVGLLGIVALEILHIAEDEHVHAYADDQHQGKTMATNMELAFPEELSLLMRGRFAF